MVPRTQETKVGHLLVPCLEHIRPAAKMFSHLWNDFQSTSYFILQRHKRPLCMPSFPHTSTTATAFDTCLNQKSIRYQVVQNSAARLLTRSKRSDHIMPPCVGSQYALDFKILLLRFSTCSRGAATNWRWQNIRRQSPKLWNELPEGSSSAETVTSIKYLLKAGFYQRASPHFTWFYCFDCFHWPPLKHVWGNVLHSTRRKGRYK